MASNLETLPISEGQINVFKCIVFLCRSINYCLFHRISARPLRLEQVLGLSAINGSVRHACVASASDRRVTGRWPLVFSFILIDSEAVLIREM